MPYEIKSINKKFKVCKKSNPKECFSKKGLTKKKAEKQKIAIEINERKIGGRNTSGFTTRMWEAYYIKFKNLMRKTGFDEKFIFPFRVFKVYFGNLYEENETYTRDDILNKIVKINKNYYKSDDEVSSDEETKEIDEEIDEKIKKLTKKFLCTVDFDDTKNDKKPERINKEIFPSVEKNSNFTSNVYDQLENLYTTILEKCKSSKDGYYGFIVNNDGFSSKCRLLSSFVKKAENSDLTRNWCINRCDGHKYNLTLFSDSIYGVAFKADEDNNIIMTAGCMLSDYGDHIYINTLCSTGGAGSIIDSFNRIIKNGNDEFWKKKSNFDYLKLSSLSDYNTVMAYYKIGFLQTIESYNYDLNGFFDYIDELIKDGLFKNRYDFSVKKIKYFKNPCTPKDPFLDELFNALHLGGSRFYFPNIEVKLGDFEIEKEGTYFLSANWHKLLEMKLQEWIDDGDESSSDGSNSDISSSDEIIVNKSSNDEKKENINGSGIKGTKFYEELKKYGINPSNYLKEMKKKAKKAGYDEKQLNFDNDDKHKLKISTEQGIRHFGAVGYKDLYIYQHLEKTNKVPKGESVKMRNRFRKSHTAISKKKKLGRNSANELAINILW